MCSSGRKTPSAFCAAEHGVGPMTKDEFVTQFLAAHRRMKETLLLVGLPVMLLNLAVAGGMFTLVNMRSENIFIYIGAAFTVCTLAMVGWVFLFRRSFSRHAPACPSCGHHLTIREREHAITKGICAKCNAPLFT
jgi:hypothetical protein